MVRARRVQRRFFGGEIMEEKFFEIKIVGKSTTHEEWEIIDLIYNLLSDKAEFQIS